MNRPLLRATRLMQNGNYRPAAQIFERLAGVARTRGRLKRAGHLSVQAARCRLQMGQRERGLELMNQGLHQLADTQSWPALHRLGPNMVAELKRLEYSQAAEDLQAWLDETLEGHPMPAMPPAGAAPGSAGMRPPRLPPACPSCGAPVRPDQANWIDAYNVECLYCGSVISAE